MLLSLVPDEGNLKDEKFCRFAARLANMNYMVETLRDLREKRGRMIPTNKIWPLDRRLNGLVGVILAGDYFTMNHDTDDGFYISDNTGYLNVLPSSEGDNPTGKIIPEGQLEGAVLPLWRLRDLISNPARRIVYPFLMFKPRDKNLETVWLVNFEDKRMCEGKEEEPIEPMPSGWT